ncbi:hypothetical protein KC730_02660 [Candidatus Kaiserbacteria bacterium]|nr:hypothetical protein [Candidatus Kaiserbacteria bacterium]
MKRFSEQLKIKAESVKLRAAEKRELRERVVSYMEYHPLPAEMKSIKTPAKIVTNKQLAEPFTSFQIPFISIFKYSAFTAVLLLLVVPFVAEKAVPGDALYAVKVQFNEELRSTLTFDTYQKVEWETERLNRRIAEARLLASEGRLTEAAGADVAEAVRVHSANAQREIAELRIEDEDAATIASITLDSTLELQSDSLRGEDELALVDGKTLLTDRPTNLIASAIDEARTPKEDEALSTSTPPAYGKLIARVEQNTTRIYELLSALEGVAPAKDLVEVTRRAEDINRAIEEAVNLYTTDEAEARVRLVTVLQRTQRLITYMTELEVIKTIDIETLIPVVLTESEQDAQKSLLTEELTQKLNLIEGLENRVSDPEVRAKVRFGIAEIDNILIAMSQSTTSLEVFKEVAQSGMDLADDSLLLLEQFVDLSQVTKDDKGTSTTPVDETEEVLIEDLVSTSSDETVLPLTPTDVVDSL